ncbi:hypothetical protein [Burkholderia phage vB_BpP_HN03]
MRAFLRSQDKMSGHWPNRTYFNVGLGSPIDVERQDYPEWLQNQCRNSVPAVVEYLDSIAQAVLAGGVMAVVLEYETMHSRSNAIWLVEFINNIISAAEEQV